MSRFMDERGRFFGKVNVVDVIVLLVIVAVVAFAVVRTTGNSSTTIPVTVQYTVDQGRQATVDALADALKVNATVRDDSGNVLGKVVDVQHRPYMEEVPTDQGQLVERASPIYSYLDIFVKGQGHLSGSTVRIGSLTVRVGAKVDLIGPGFEVQTVVMHVDSGQGASK